MCIRDRVLTYKGERDTLMTPRDSILHHKRIMRASFVALDPRTGYVKASVSYTHLFAQNKRFRKDV